MNDLEENTIAIEKALIGKLIFDPSLLFNKQYDFRAELLFDKQLKRILTGIEEIIDKYSAIDDLLLAKRLVTSKKINDGDYDFAMNISKDLSNELALEYIKSIKENYVRRNITDSCIEIINIDKETSDAFDLELKLEAALFKCHMITNKKHPEHISKLMMLGIESIEDSASNEVNYPSSGFQNLDLLINGWQLGTVSVIASRPGMGKSVFLTNMIVNSASKKDLKIGFIGLDSTSAEDTNRMISKCSKVPYQELIRGVQNEEDFYKIHSSILNLADSQLFCIYPENDLKNIEYNITTLKKINDVEIVYLDNLQLVSLKSKYRELEISTIIKRLKQLAKRLNIAIVVTSQLSRSVELRGGSKRPLLSDLRDSGSIEEEAHVVAFLYRPEYYALEYTEMGEMLVPGATELIVSKHKNGPTGSLYYKFIPEVLTFEEVKNETDLIDTSVNSPFENPVL